MLYDFIFFLYFEKVREGETLLVLAHGPLNSWCRRTRYGQPVFRTFYVVEDLDLRPTALKYTTSNAIIFYHISGKK